MENAGTILVVGSSTERRELFAELLAGGGHTVVPLSQPDRIVGEITRLSPAIVIIDQVGENAADSDPLAICRLIRDARPGVFLLQICTAAAAQAVGGDPLVDALLVDPVEPQELLVLVRFMLRLRKVETDLRDSEERLKLAQDSAEIAVLDWSIAQNTFVHSDRFAALFDFDSADASGPLEPGHILSRIHPDDIDALVAEFATDSRTAEKFNTEFRIVRRDGAIRWISSRGQFFTTASGEPQRMLSLNFDVTDRKESDRVNAELAAIVSSSVDAIVSVDQAGLVTSWNAGAERMFGLASPAILGRPLSDAVAAFHSEADGGFRDQVANGGTHEFDFQHTGVDGQRMALGITSAPVLGPDGRSIGTSLIIRDTTAQTDREDHIRFLMRELTHRSKNLLAVIQAMARQSLTKGITPDEFIKRFSDRLAGLAGSHDLLSSVAWRGASLFELIRSQLSHYKDLFGTRIELGEPDLFLKPEAAQNIGVALHELSTNAAKYGALSNDDGVVSISWSITGIDEDRVLALRWRERGGPPVTVPTRKGFGTIVMDRIAGRALGGRSSIDFSPGGIVWTMDVPARTALVD